MKRAKLTQAPAAASGGADLTDRLLGVSPGEAKKKAAPPAAKAASQRRAPAKPVVKDKPARRAPAARKSAPAEAEAPAAAPPAPRAAGDLPKFEPYHTVAAKPTVTPGPALERAAMAALPEDMPAALRQALAETEKALAALVAAAEGLPARHDLAVRYRLDALRHHLQQVSDFLASRRA